jgi:hypothetical protein
LNTWWLLSFGYSDSCYIHIYTDIYNVYRWMLIYLLNTWWLLSLELFWLVFNENMHWGTMRRRLAITSKTSIWMAVSLSNSIDFVVIWLWGLTYIYIYIYIYIHLYIYTYLHIHMYIYIHTFWWRFVIPGHVLKDIFKY